MKTLYLRIYATVVAVLLLFALASGWLVQRNFEAERARSEAGANERLQAWAELLHNALPAADAPEDDQAQALLDWSARLRIPLALDDGTGRRIATAPAYARFTGIATDEAAASGSTERLQAQRLALSDGRTLWIVRPGLVRAAERAAGAPPRRHTPEPPFFARGIGLVLTLGVLFIAVAAGAYPVVRRLTRRLEALKQGVEAFGAGALDHRVDASGRDEVAAVASSFNAAAARIESLVQAHQSLLANASHELRSPLARMKMALAMLETTPPERRPALQAEIDRNIRELDALVEEVLLASRLDARQGRADDERVRDPVDVLALAAEEAARAEAVLDLPEPGTPAVPATLPGEERLLRRALRNLLENARRYGGAQPPELQLRRVGARLELRVLDRGSGVPEAQRERIFEPFYRLPGHAEQAGGVGLGLSLVRQIARHHGGEVHCEAREGGGSCFVLSLPLA